MIRERVDRARLAGVGAAGERDLRRAGRGQLRRAARRRSRTCAPTSGCGASGAARIAPALAGFATPLQWRVFSRHPRVAMAAAGTAIAGVDPMDRSRCWPRCRWRRFGRGLAARRRPGDGQARPREGEADRRRGVRRMPRRRRQQRDRGESEHRGTGRRLYHPATRALQGGHPREPDHAGHGGPAVAGRHGRRSASIYSQQKPKGLAARDAQLVAIGQALCRGGDAASGLPACAACHAPTGAGIPKNFPRLSGQYADYTYAQLKAFKRRRARQRQGRQGRQRPHHGRDRAAHERRADEGAVAEYAAGLR